MMLRRGALDTSAGRIRQPRILRAATGRPCGQ
jgi:hypothetical protein